MQKVFLKIDGRNYADFLTTFTFLRLMFNLAILFKTAFRISYFFMDHCYTKAWPELRSTFFLFQTKSFSFRCVSLRCGKCVFITNYMFAAKKDKYSLECKKKKKFWNLQHWLEFWRYKEIIPTVRIRESIPNYGQRG